MSFRYISIINNYQTLQDLKHSWYKYDERNVQDIISYTQYKYITISLYLYDVRSVHYGFPPLFSLIHNDHLFWYYFHATSSLDLRYFITSDVKWVAYLNNRWVSSGGYFLYVCVNGKWVIHAFKYLKNKTYTSSFAIFIVSFGIIARRDNTVHVSLDNDIHVYLSNNLIFGVCLPK